MTDVISVAGLGKTFGKALALDGLDLTVAAGEIHGFLGPNGAGKTTTLRVLLGLIKASSGQALLFGQDPWSNATELHKRLAYVPGDVSLWPNLTGGQTIDLLGRMRGGIDPARRAALIERFELDPSKKCRAYSKGNRQKVVLIAALAAQPELLILDEPTAGLDPLMEVMFRQVLAEQSNSGQTVLLSSHILSEVESACDRVTIIRNGKTIDTGTLADMRHFSRTSIAAQLHEIPSGLSGLPGIHELQVDGNNVTFQVDPDSINQALAVLSAAGVSSLVSAPPTLEELFLRHYSPEGSPSKASV